MTVKFESYPHVLGSQIEMIELMRHLQHGQLARC